MLNSKLSSVTKFLIMSFLKVDEARAILVLRPNIALNGGG